MCVLKKEFETFNSSKIKIVYCLHFSTDMRTFALPSSYTTRRLKRRNTKILQPSCDNRRVVSNSSRR